MSTPIKNPLSRGIRFPEYTGGRPRYNFRWEFGYLFEVHSLGYRAAMMEKVFKDLAHQAVDKDAVQKLIRENPYATNYR